MKKLFARLMITAVMLFAASMVEAQRMGDDTYVVLGHGYAKDSENVYLNGQVLPWVDPHTFSLKRCDGHQSYRCFEKYVISHFDVFYDGKKLDDASASSFSNLIVHESEPVELLPSLPISILTWFISGCSPPNNTSSI